ncbi:MAG: hypothetical protein PHT12_04495 [Patescibacteria group bacterium]|nr:hypothetical protein [Patescibacteria group bacterium]
MKHIGIIRSLLMSRAPDSVVSGALRSFLESSPTDAEVHDVCVAFQDWGPQLYAAALSADVKNGDIPLSDADWLWFDRFGQAPTGRGLKKSRPIDLSLIYGPPKHPSPRLLNERVARLVEKVAAWHIARESCAAVKAQPVDEPAAMNPASQDQDTPSVTAPEGAVVAELVEVVSEHLDQLTGTASSRSGGAVATKLAISRIDGDQYADDEALTALDTALAICGKESLLGRTLSARYESRRGDASDSRPTIRVPAVAA